MKPRYFAKRPKGLPKGYDSWLEHDLHENELKGYNHHPERLAYTVKHKYEPDFVLSSAPNILIEVKGRFRDSTEAAKYKWIRDCNPDIELVFIFEDPKKPMPFAKVRKKCGTKQTHGDWATKNGFRFYSKNNLEEFLCGEK